MDRQSQNEIRRLSHIWLVIALVCFSAFIVILNRMSGWESWVIPILICTVVLCLGMHIQDSPSLRLRTYLFSLFLMIELFYFTAHVHSVYDSTPVICVLLVIIALTFDLKLMFGCMLVGYAGMVYHLITIDTLPWLSRHPTEILHALWHFVTIGLDFLVVRWLLNTLIRSERNSVRVIRALEDENARAGNFLANVSHELRTPLNVITGLAELCVDREQDEDILQNLNSMSEAGSRVGELISDILDYSEIDMKKIVVNRDDYMMSSLLGDLLTQLMPLKKENVELIFDVDVSLPSVLHSDMPKIRTILRHLISNGLKFTNKGGVYVRISQIRQAYGINLFIEITDTGIGMNEAETKSIISKFYQGDSSRSRSAGGLGLGIPIVIGFIGALDGFLTIESSEGKGTTVTVSIPQQVVDPTPYMKIENRREISMGLFFDFRKYRNPQVRDFYAAMLTNLATGFGLKFHRPPTFEALRMLAESTSLTHFFIGWAEYEEHRGFMDKMAKSTSVTVVVDDISSVEPGPGVRLLQKPFYCIQAASILANQPDENFSEQRDLYLPDVRALVVDDEPMNITVANRILRMYGMNVSSAESGQEAIDICTETPFDIIFMDHMMPKMDGVEAMKRIRAQAGRSNQEFSIVALTANALSTAREMFLSEGFDGFVSKPIDRTELERVLIRVLPASLISYRDETGAPENASTEDQDIFRGLHNLGIDYKMGIYYAQEDEQFYRQLLLEFVDDSRRKRQMITDALNDGLYEDYQVQVHSLKSSAKMLGAQKLSDLARDQEAAAGRDDIAFILENNDSMIREYDRIRKGISEIFAHTGDDLPQSTGKESVSDNDGAYRILEFSPEV